MLNCENDGAMAEVHLPPVEPPPFEHLVPDEIIDDEEFIRMLRAIEAEDQSISDTPDPTVAAVPLILPQHQPPDEATI